METKDPIKDVKRESPSLNLGNVKKAIAARNAIFAGAMARKDAAGVADCYTVDGQFMPPFQTSVVGRDNIRSAIAGYIEEGFTKYEVLSSDVWGDSGVVGVQSQYTLSKTDGNDKDSGKTIQLWKQEDGAWKIFRDCFNSNLPEST